MIKITDAFKSTYPGAHLGVLIMRNVYNFKDHNELDSNKRELERKLRQNYADYTRAELKNLKPIQIYDQYYRRFKKTYHVLLQLESVALKGKDIPKVSTLVEAMFMAELKNLLLTAGHDLDSLDLPIQLDAACGNERYLQINGEEKEIVTGDMMIADGEGVISSVIYGPDYRTRITPQTRNILFVVYGPPGIEGYEIFEHLQDIKSNVMVFSPDAEIDLLKVYGTKVGDEAYL